MKLFRILAFHGQGHVFLETLRSLSAYFPQKEDFWNMYLWANYVPRDASLAEILVLAAPAEWHRQPVLGYLLGEHTQCSPKNVHNPCFKAKIRRESERF